MGSCYRDVSNRERVVNLTQHGLPLAECLDHLGGELPVRRQQVPVPQSPTASGAPANGAAAGARPVTGMSRLSEKRCSRGESGRDEAVTQTYG
jgi:hypothetical protein